MSTRPACRSARIIITCAASAPTATPTTLTIIPILTRIPIADVRHLRDGRLERGQRAAAGPRQYLDLPARPARGMVRQPADPACGAGAVERAAGGGAGKGRAGPARLRFSVRLCRRFCRPARTGGAALARRLGRDRAPCRGRARQPQQPFCGGGAAQPADLGRTVPVLGMPPGQGRALACRHPSRRLRGRRIGGAPVGRCARLHAGRAALLEALLRGLGRRSGLDRDPGRARPARGPALAPQRARVAVRNRPCRAAAGARGIRGNLSLAVAGRAGAGRAQGQGAGARGRPVSVRLPAGRHARRPVPRRPGVDGGAAPSGRERRSVDPGRHRAAASGAPAASRAPPPLARRRAASKAVIFPNAEARRSGLSGRARGRTGGLLPKAGPFALVALLCLLLYAPGLVAIPTLDRDEARFAQATRQMLETGDFLRIRFQNRARDKKPAGIYWLQAAAVGLFSTPASSAIWPYRLPSALGAAAAALATLGLGRALFADDRRAGLFAAVLMASALDLVAEAHIAKTDAALLAAAVAGQGLLGVVYMRARAGHPVGWPLSVGFWIAEAAGILLKGPVAPLIALATAASLAIADRDGRWLARLRPLAGIGVVALLVLPWLVAIERATDGRFLTQSLGHDLLPKLLGGQQGHGAPPGTYLVLAPVTFWPGSLLIASALAWGWRHARAPAERFLLAWLVPAWLVFELVPTKLPHYVLPLYPALALLAGRALSQGLADAGIADRLVRAAWALATCGLAALLILLPVQFGRGISPAGIIGAAAVMVIAAAALRRRPPVMTAALLAALAVAFVIPAAAILPGLDRLWLSRAAAALVARHPPPPGRPVVAIGYSEPSLVFLLGTKTRLLSVPAAARALARGGAALVDMRQEAPLRRALAARGLSLRAEGRVAGLDYSTGRELVLTLYNVTPG